LGAGHKPRIVVLNKSDLVDATNGGGVSGGIIGRDDQYVLKVSGLTGIGIDALRQMIGQMLAERWSEVDVLLPYSAGGLMARARERGSVAFEYRDEDVRMEGKVPPTLAGELMRVGASWKRVQRAREDGDAGGAEVADELLTAGKIAEQLGVSAGKVSKTIKAEGLEPDQKKGNCGYYGADKVKQIAEALKAR